MNFDSKSSVSNKIRLLFVIGPKDVLPSDLLIKKLNEITVELKESSKVYVLGGYPKARSAPPDLPSPFELRMIRMKAFSRNPITMIMYLVFCIFEGIKLVKEEDIHVIMCYGGHVHLGLVAYIISRLTRRKCIVRVSADFLIPLYFLLKDSGSFFFENNLFLNVVSLIYRRLETFLFKHFDWIITQGPMDFIKVKKVTSKIIFIPLWVDLERFRPLDEEFVKRFKESLTDNDEVKILLFVGRLHPEKGVRTLLEAFRAVVESYGRSKVLLILVGMGIANYMEEYKETAIRMEVADRTRFIGYVPHDELTKYYNIADLYILPSLREEWSNTIMEAMACKVPVIATKVGGNPYLVVEGKTGFLVPPKNPRRLAEEIMFVLDNTSLAKKMSENAILEIKEYSKDKIGKLHKSVILNVIKTEFK